jgi:hypothetical protein
MEHMLVLAFHFNASVPTENFVMFTCGGSFLLGCCISSWTKWAVTLFLPHTSFGIFPFFPLCFGENIRRHVSKRESCAPFIQKRMEHSNIFSEDDGDNKGKRTVFLRFYRQKGAVLIFSLKIWKWDEDCTLYLSASSLYRRGNALSLLHDQTQRVHTIYKSTIREGRKIRVKIMCKRRDVTIAIG